jgi:hypothetical protein
MRGGAGREGKRGARKRERGRGRGREGGSLPPAPSSGGAARTSSSAEKPESAEPRESGRPIDAPCTQRLRHGDPMHARKGLTAAAAAAQHGAVVLDRRDDLGVQPLHVGHLHGHQTSRGLRRRARYHPRTATQSNHTHTSSSSRLISFSSFTMLFSVRSARASRSASRSLPPAKETAHTHARERQRQPALSNRTNWVHGATNGVGRSDRGGGRVHTQVSTFLAWIGSRCLGRCVHGAPIEALT